MKSLSILGCGRVGKTLGRLFRDAGLFEIRDILNRTPESGEKAAVFIGAGRSVAGFRELRPSDFYLIGAVDGAIAGLAEALAASGVIVPGCVACHLSGALPSSLLAPLQALGCLTASVHPVKSFADPGGAVADFAGTWCGVEGDPRAVALLGEAFGALGGRMFAVDPNFKTIYHAASVLVSNYLTSLIEVGVRAYRKGGLSRETALEVLEPLARGTLDNIVRAGTEKALTGPIARGDAAVVAAQLAALDDWDGEIALLYRVLGRVALDLSRRQGVASERDLARLRELLAGCGSADAGDGSG